MTTILSDENFDSEVKNSDKLVLVDFFAIWCEPCTMLAPILEKVVEEFKGEIVLMKVNLDNASKTAEKYGVEKIPTVVLFKNGQAVSGFVGLVPEASVKIWVENLLVAEITERYDSYAKSNGFRLNPDKKVVERVVKGLLANEKKSGKKYCPCRRISGNAEEDAKKICPCVWHKDEIEKDGHCFCNLYVKG